MSSTSFQPVPDPPSSSQSNLYANFEKLSRGAALITAFIYVCGFVIVSTNSARFGVAEYSFFKPRIFSAGLLLLVFISLPAIVAFRVFNIFGLTRSTGVAINFTSDNKRYVNWLLVFGFFVVARYVALLTHQFFGDGLGFAINRGWSDHICEIASFAVFALAVFVVQKRINERPKSCILLNALIALLFAIRDFYSRDTLLCFGLVMWCYLIGLIAVALVSELKKPESRRQIEWEIAVLIFTGIALFWFSVNVYANIKPEYGGGLPIRIAITFEEKPVGLPGQILVGNLVDQTEDGYYVLPASLGAKCVFVPKTKVALVRFLQVP